MGTPRAAAMFESIAAAPDAVDEDAWRTESALCNVVVTQETSLEICCLTSWRAMPKMKRVLQTK